MKIRSIKLRSNLFVLTIVTLLPMIVFAIIAAALFAHRERETFRRGGMERTLALRTAIDTELKRSISTLQALATSQSLDRSDLGSFWDDAQRVLKDEKGWLTINLVSPQGKQSLRPLRFFNAEAQVAADRESFELALKTREATVGNLVFDAASQDYYVSVWVPVEREGVTKFVLVAAVKPQTFAALLSPQRLPPKWVAEVLDANKRIVARTVDPQSTVGRLASDSLRSALGRASEGWFQGNTIEGWKVYTPFNRSSFSDWTVALGIPADVVEAAARQTTWAMTAGLLAAGGLALVLALVFGEKISRPIVALAAAAKAVGRGEKPLITAGSSVEEVTDLARALEDAAAALREREETQSQLAAIVESSSDAIISYTLEGAVLTWNPAATRLFGYTLEESRGRDILFLVPRELTDEATEIFTRVAGGESRWLETERIRKDGSRVPVALTVFPMRNAAGAVTAVTMAARDITQQKEAEAALREADRRKDEFLATLGHELRNPLGIISTSVGVMNKKPLPDPSLRELREMIERQSRHMSRLLDDLLDVSRIARGRIRLNKQPCDLVSIVRDAAQDYRPLLESSKLRLMVEAPPEPLWVMGDATRLAQIVGNVLHNARKFSDPGGTVRVCLIRAPYSPIAILTVKDTGIGMDAETLAQVFESFSQGDRLAERERGGLGLGLSLVKGLVELHGGETRVSSEGLGRGTEVTIRLPLEASPVVPAEPPAAPADVTQPRRVLIIEDNPVAARSMQLFLEDIGHSVEVAHNGPEGIEAARRYRPDVILCDIGLPGVNGYDVTRTLRQEISLEHTFLIAVTGYGQDEDRQRALDAGFDEHLTKPVDLDTLELLLKGMDSHQAAVNG